MNGPFEITLFTEYRKNPRRVTVADLAELSTAIGAHADGCWSMCHYELDRQLWAESSKGKRGYGSQSEDWRSAAGILLDFDCLKRDLTADELARNPRAKPKKVPLCPDARAAFEELLRTGELDASFGYATPSGFRIGYIFDATSDDPVAYRKAMAGAIELVIQQLAFHGLLADPEEGKTLASDATVSTKVTWDTSTSDLARVMWSPNAIVKGVQRQADFIICNDKRWSVDALAALAPPEPAPEEKPAKTKRVRPSFTGNYTMTDDGIFMELASPDGEVSQRRLTNFWAVITGEHVKDSGDGDPVKTFTLTGGMGSHQQDFEVTAKDFQDPGVWAMASLGGRASILPGTSRQAVMNAVQTASAEEYQRLVTYSHSGWRQHGDAEIYLHAGAPGCDLQGKLKYLALPEDSDDPDQLQANVQALLDLLALHIWAPVLVGAAFRAAIDASTADLSLFLHGPTGSGKSQLAALAQSFFGAAFADDVNLPASFGATASAVGISELAFIAKDALLVVDDLKFTGDAYEDSKIRRIASTLLHDGAGNRQGRQRGRPDGSLRPAHPPRCLIVATGEHVLQGHSTLGRCLSLGIKPGELIDETQPEVSALLTKCQGHAADGAFVRLMARFIQWLASSLGRRQQWIDKLNAVQQEWRSKRLGGLPRSADNAAQLMLGAMALVAFLKDLGIDDADAIQEGCQTALLMAVKVQKSQLADEDPVERFLDLLQQSLDSHQSCIDSTPSPATPVIGHQLPEGVFLLPSLCIKMVKELARMEGRPFPGTVASIGAELVRRNILISKAKDRNQSELRIDGKTRKGWLVPHDWFGKTIHWKAEVECDEA